MSEPEFATRQSEYEYIPRARDTGSAFRPGQQRRRNEISAEERGLLQQHPTSVDRGTSREPSGIQQLGPPLVISARAPQRARGTVDRRDRRLQNTPLPNVVDIIARNYSILTDVSQTGPARSSPGVRLSRALDRGLNLTPAGQVDVSEALSDSTSYFTRGVIHGIRSETHGYSLEAIERGVDIAVSARGAGLGISFGIGLSVYEDFVDQITMVRWFYELTTDEISALESTIHSVISGLFGAENKVLVYDFGAALGTSQTREILDALTGTEPSWYQNLPEWVKMAAPWRSVAFGRLIAPMVLAVVSVASTAATAGAASPALALRALSATSGAVRRLASALRRLIPRRVRRLARQAFDKLAELLRRAPHVPNAPHVPDVDLPRAPGSAPALQSGNRPGNLQGGGALNDSLRPPRIAYVTENQSLRDFIRRTRGPRARVIENGYQYEAYVVELHRRQQRRIRFPSATGEVAWRESDHGMQLGSDVAVEAKFTRGWRNSPYNPNRAVSAHYPWDPDASVERFLDQAEDYVTHFNEVIYYSNDLQMIRYWSRVFAERGWDNIRWIFAPSRL